MAVTVYIPTPFRRATSNRDRVEVRPGDVRAALDELEAAYGGLRGLVRNERGEIHRHIAIYVNSEARTGALRATTPAQARCHRKPTFAEFFSRTMARRPAMSGGAASDTPFAGGRLARSMKLADQRGKDRADGPPDHRVGHLPASRPVSALGKSTSHTSRQERSEELCPQEVAAHMRHSQALLLLRQKLTGDAPPGWIGCASAGQSRPMPPRLPVQPKSHPQ